jgi:hypothetical protein
MTRFAAQIHPTVLRQLTSGERLHRLAALATELYGSEWSAGLMRDMRKSSREIARWKAGTTPVPKVVLVALGAMLAAKRAGV